MKYLDQINVFWLLDAEHSFNGNESRLYFYLLKLSNSLYWKNPLTNADGHTAVMVGISVNTLKTARNRLQQAGLLIIKPGGNGQRDKCLYTIVPADEVEENIRLKSFRCQNLTPNLQPNLQPNPYPNQQKADDIYRDRIKEINKEGWTGEIKMGWNSMPTAADIGDLPQADAEAVLRQQVASKKITADQFIKREVTEADVGEYFKKIFLPTEVRGTKHYNSEDDVFLHFVRYCNGPKIYIKKAEAQTFKTTGINSTQTTNAAAANIARLKGGKT